MGKASIQIAFEIKRVQSNKWWFFKIGMIALAYLNIL